MAANATPHAKATTAAFASLLFLLALAIAATGAEVECEPHPDIGGIPDCMIGCAFEVIDFAMETMGCAMGCAGGKGGAARARGVAAGHTGNDDCVRGDDPGSCLDPRPPAA
ncbi:hypothetical protein ACP4OV_000867 [Aristida adscensionis]